MAILNGIRLANKCKVCGKIINEGILCKNCQHRIRNYRWLTHFLGQKLLKYPLDDLEDESEEKKDDVVIAS